MWSRLGHVTSLERVGREFGFTLGLVVVSRVAPPSPSRACRMGTMWCSVVRVYLSSLPLWEEGLVAGTACLKQAPNDGGADREME